MQTAGCGNDFDFLDNENMILNYYTLSLVLSILSIIVVFFLALIIWNRRPAPGTVPFTLFLLVVIIWVFIRSIMVATPDMQIKISLGDLMYFLTAAISISWLCFALDYTGSRWWRRPRNILLLFLIPLITVILHVISQREMTNWLGVYPDIDASNIILVWKKGVVTWVQTAYIGGLLLTGCILLGRSAYYGKADQRWKIVVILFSSLIPMASHAANTAGYYPVKGLDFTPVALALAGIIYATTIFRFRFLDIIPAARNTLVERIPDGILVLDAKGYIADMNPAAESLSGINRASAQGKKLEDVCPWLHNAVFSATPGNHIELGPVITGSRFFLEASITLLKDKQSAVTGRLVVVEDITHRKKAGEALRDSEEKYRSLVNNIKLGVFRATHQGKHLEINKAMENITGYSRQELLEMDAKNLYWHPEDRHLILNQSILSPERAASEVWNRKKDGSRIMVSVTVTPVRDSDGSLLYFDGILEDITERKRMLEQIHILYEKEKVQRQELEAETQARGIFINTLGHELRTPLTPLVVSAESLKEHFNRDPQSIESKLINNVYNGSRMLVQRLNELLELGKFSRGDITIKLQTTNLKALVEKAAAQCQPEIAAKEQKLVLDLEAGLHVLEADPLLLEQVLGNLLSNAAKLSPQGGSVFLRAGASEDGVLIEVRDEGKGISPEEQKRLFQPYHRVEQDRTRCQGLGLGLAISRQIIDAHHGRIWLTSHAGQGNTFSIFLPVKPSAGRTLLPGNL
jgi:PAS domain S-box-containing protein